MANACLTVAVRIRPMDCSEHERKILKSVDDRMLVFDPSPAGSENKLQEVDSNVVTGTGVGKHNRRRREHRFVFDRLFDDNSTQEEVYDYTARPVLGCVLNGYNATVFAYGATGCGKTYTISGDPDSPGVIFLTMEELFEKIKDSGNEVEVTLSYLEIYNEKIKDLLSPETDSSKLQLRESSNQQIFVTNLSKHKPQSVHDVMDLIMAGNQNRTVSPTAANAVSSRSHAVLQVTLLQHDKTVGLTEQQTESTLSFIDLAGSERASATQNRGERLHEGANINKSLLALGNCINALIDSRSGNHIPYRDSKLTRLLKFSLGGNCKTVMIVCVSPSASHYDETLNALKYGNRAKSIKTKVVRNRVNVSTHVGAYLKIIRQQKDRIEELEASKAEIAAAAIKEYEADRTRCYTETEKCIKRLTTSLEKNYNAKLNKAMVLSKRRFLLIERAAADQFLRASNDEGLIQSVRKLLLVLDKDIEALNSEYSKPDDLDFILKRTSKSMLGNLEKLPTWGESDRAHYTSEVKRLNEATKRSIQYEASVIFEESISQYEPLKFAYDSLFNALEEVSPETGRRIIAFCEEAIRQLAGESFNLVKSTGITPKASHLMLSSPKKARKASELIFSSPRKATPTKRGPNSSMEVTPTRKVSLSNDKKVRWQRKSPPHSRHGSASSKSFDATDDPMQEECEPPARIPISPVNRLTSRTLTASPKIASPGRIAGLGYSSEITRLGDSKAQILPFLLKEPHR